MEHVARISYGKDSMKMLEVIHSRKLPLDRITTTDVWATDAVPAWLPPLGAFRDRMDEWIWEKYRIEVEHLCARNKDGTKRTYEQMFYHVPKRKAKDPLAERTDREFASGSILGLPDRWAIWCQSALKKVPDYRVQGSIKGFPGTTGAKWCQKLKHNWVRDTGIPGADLAVVQEDEDRPGKDAGFSECPTRRAKRNIVEYIGIAADEPKRHKQLTEQLRAPLVEFGIEEELCGLYCRHAGCLSPTYESSFRDGCWFCHNQGVGQLRLLRKNYPELWALLMKWDLDSPVSFKPNGKTVHDYDRRFRLEDEGLIKPEDRFLWSMLDEELNYRWF